MNIAIFSHSHPFYSKGGGEVVAFNSFEALRDAGANVYLYSAINLGLKPNLSIFSEGENLIEFAPQQFLFPVRTLDPFLFTHQDRSFFPTVVQQLKSQKIDAFHFHHFWNVGTDLVLHLKQNFPNAAFVLTLHELLGICARDGQMVRNGSNALCTRATDIECHMCFPHIDKDHFRARRTFFKDFLEQFDVITSPSEFLAERFAAWGLEKDLYIIENGYNRPAALESPAGVSEDRLTRRFAFFGQASPFKGIDVFVSAAAQCLADENATAVFAIYGCDRQRFLEQFGEQWKETLDRAGAGLQFMGAYDPSQVFSLMQQNGWIVIPSIWWENSPLVIQEAFIANRPPIVADIGGMKEKVANGITGLHFSARNSASLADVMRLATGDVGYWRSLRSQQKPPPTMDEMNESFLELFRSKSAAA